MDIIVLQYSSFILLFPYRLRGPYLLLSLFWRVVYVRFDSWNQSDDIPCYLATQINEILGDTLTGGHAKSISNKMPTRKQISNNKWALNDRFLVIFFLSLPSKLLFRSSISCKHIKKIDIFKTKNWENVRVLSENLSLRSCWDAFVVTARVSVGDNIVVDEVLKKMLASRPTVWRRICRRSHFLLISINFSRLRCQITPLKSAFSSSARSQR